MEKKLRYVAPFAEIVQVRLRNPIQQDDDTEFGSGYDESLGRRQSFFGEDEEDEEGMINGGSNMFQLWEDEKGY